ncbi:hypothetical protein JW711_00255 [Candidatus Woesearchaeota archaeon]|nr:hypothetical protein [Candidatus Woesearchaeota archaeon]
MKELQLRAVWLGCNNDNFNINTNNNLDNNNAARGITQHNNEDKLILLKKII